MDKILYIYFKDNYKDMIVDCLLNDEFDDFYYFQCKQYSTKMLKSTKERVTGRIDYGKIEVRVNSNNQEKIINKLFAMIGREHLKIFTRLIGDITYENLNC